MSYPAHPAIEAFIADIPTMPKAPGVVGYALGDRYRNRADQEAAREGGTSDAGYGDSAHNVHAPDDAWRGAAVDVFPVLSTSIQDIDNNGLPDVSPDPAHYQPIVDLAAAHGLQNLGAMYGVDYAHVQVPNWRQYPVLPDGEPVEGGSGGGGLFLLFLLGLVFGGKVL